ncbi:Gfo/Idh/MocA family oxidoreductase [Noviherbaspirillum sp. L7-7A]|uniref:Gfo/Idh/MocA family protein n=1 Tax=Noviherbaspirillum sp. L7-7A TaxID=2850560 RepID=UPI001C2C6AD9|nr:Gfo/Idh/MocA family oxidoreductase [Noviherbaspirillum sp. L7-7A]MBV0881436.1 Gfo/Idh/MocA family oxidoreductase [Noviherbaspirillum sp. L7-7A]
MPPSDASAPLQSSFPSDQRSGRRAFLKYAGGIAAGIAPLAAAHAQSTAGSAKVDFPPDHAQSEASEKMPDPGLPPAERIGYAVVGLGRLTVGRLLPALAQCKYSRLSALVSGDRAKAQKLARQYGLAEQSIYDYGNFDAIATNPDVQVVYIVLPNSMHAEFTIRAARAGKHVLCEKPMANSVAECQQMIQACQQAQRKLMIAYRSQYEPLARALLKMARDKKLGDLREFISANSQNMGDPAQWRLKKALAGGGPLPDVGIYCINAARFLSGEEPVEVQGGIVNNQADPRFREVEESVQFTLRFPSGFTATCSSGYNSHKSQFLRLQGTLGWAELDPGYAYEGNRLRYGLLENGREVIHEPSIAASDQFMLEIDHMSQCVRQDRLPHTPGEEGLQDQRIIEAIYASAQAGRVIRLDAPGNTRGPEPQQEG